MIANKWGFPDLGFGMGLRTVHYSHILEHWPKVDFFEIIVENYMGSGGRPIYILEQIAERYPVLLHGVSLSVGSTDPVDFEYLKLLKNLIRLVKARWVSDHLCWTGILGRNTHDLLPMPLTQESLEHVSRRVQVIQDFLEVPLVLENPSTYLEWAQDQMTEWDYLNALTAETDCGLLLDGRARRLAGRMAADQLQPRGEAGRSGDDAARAARGRSPNLVCVRGEPDQQRKGL